MKTTQLKKELVLRINERIKQLKTKLALLIIIPVIGLTACNKDFNEPLPEQPQLIEQTFTMYTLNKERIAKSFDLSQWVYNYSPEKYELKLTSIDGKYIYSKLVSIPEIISGGVTFKMFAGVYNVSYNPVHRQKFDDVLDIGINMSNLNINGNPITLQGTIQDALIVLDRDDIFPVIDENGQPCFYQDNRGFWYAYVNSGYNIKAIIQATGEQIPISQAIVNLGYVYWYSKTIDGNINLIIPEMKVERISF